MLRVRFEHTILVFERSKIFHALDRAATVIGVLHTFHCQSFERGLFACVVYLVFIYPFQKCLTLSKYVLSWLFNDGLMC
jgi:hypothetical protein